MTNSTESPRSTRGDARGFADAFAEADDAFTFGPDAEESRTLTLAELGELIALDGPVDLRGAPRSAERAPSAPPPSGPPAPGDGLLSLDELGEALARPVAPADDLEFDFGTSAHERARRRTAARLGTSASSRRRASGVAARPRRGFDELAPPVSSVRAATVPAAPPVASARAGATAPPAGTGLLAVSAGAGPLIAPVRSAGRPATTRPAAVERLRANPDRVAMWAVLLGIVLVLIAVTSGSAGAIALPVLLLVGA